MSRVVAVDGFNNIDNFTRKLEILAKRYPDKCDILLKKDAIALRKDIIKVTKRKLKTNNSHKQSLAKARSYKISRPMGFGGNKSIDISATAPHFHLVEHGHEIWVPDRFIPNGKKIKKGNVLKHAKIKQREGAGGFVTRKDKNGDFYSLVHKGHTRAFNQLKEATDNHHSKMRKNVEVMVNDMLRECGLL